MSLLTSFSRRMMQTSVRMVARRSLATASTTGGAAIQALQAENPHVDVVQYLHKNRTWNVKHVHYYSEALAIGLVENGLQPGDKVLSWLPQHFSEQMVLQFACSKAGLVLYSLDPKLAIEQPAQAQEALAAALTLTQANVLVSQEAGDDTNYVRLAENTIPELRFFDYSDGAPFVTPHFPHLRFCLHTGFDQIDKWGWLPLRHMIVPSGTLDDFVQPASILPETPLAGGFEYQNGMPVKLSPVLSNQQVIDQKVWPTYSKILDKQFHTVEGTGVVF